MARKLIDLSMPVHNDMVAFPRVVRPSMAMFETWQQFAERIGAAAHGVGWLTASCIIVMGDHIGTHIDSLRHLRDDAPGPEGIPLEYCYGDGVCLDFRHLPKGAGITVEDVKAALTKINYTLKPLDIVLIHTGAGKIQDSEAYLTDHVGMTAAATHYLLDQGIKVMGIDADYVRPAGMGDVRAQAVLGSAPRHAGTRALSYGEHDEPGSTAGARIHAQRAAHQVGQHHGSAGSRDGDSGGLEWPPPKRLPEAPHGTTSTSSAMALPTAVLR